GANDSRTLVRSRQRVVTKRGIPMLRIERWLACGALCILGITNTACVTAADDTDVSEPESVGVQSAQVFAQELDPTNVGGDVADHSGDGKPDLFMSVKTKSKSAAAMLVSDKAGSAKLLVHMLAAGEGATPDLALSGYEIGSGTIGDLMD